MTPANPATNDDVPLAPAAADPAARQARHILALRRRRRDHFADVLFGEPGWELMLHLYVADAELRRLSVHDAMALLSVPTSTARRWIALLASEGLVVEEGEGRTLALTAAARLQLEAFLCQFADTSPTPAWRRSAPRAV